MDYDAGKVAGFSRQVLRLHARGGYPFARAALSVAPAGSVGERPGLVIDMTVDPDRPCVFGPLVLAGTFATKRTQLARDVLYREGTGYDIDRVERTAARLMSRSYIAAVTAGDPVLVAQRDGMESDSGTPVVVPLTIRDRSGLGLDGALGFERGVDGRARLYGSLDFSLHNILGVGDRAALFYKGEKEGHRLALTLSKMHLASVPLLLSGEFGLEVRERQFGHLHGVLTGLLDIATRWRAGLAVRGHETTVTDSQSVQWTVYGGDFIVERVAEGYRRGVLSRQVRLLTGSSLVDRGGTASTRWNVELAAGAHVPFGRIHAVAARVVSNNLFTVEERLTPVELYRTGGNRTVRGYAEDQFAFRNAAWLQAEYGVYFSPAGSVYIFCDGGVGSRQSVTTGPEGRVPLLGYGVGIRLPVKIGEMALEWARNKDDGRGLGRVHVGFRNMVSSGISQ